jgi:two-component system, cell cycle sensor histidine kinase and response regulator CckA
MNMPVMDGTATVAALRRLDPRVRIVAASGRDLPDPLREGPLAVQGLLAKPYTAAQLLSALAEALGAPPLEPSKDAAPASELLEDRNGLH